LEGKRDLDTLARELAHGSTDTRSALTERLVAALQRIAKSALLVG
jgi:hypothetical protein